MAAKLSAAAGAMVPLAQRDSSKYRFSDFLNATGASLFNRHRSGDRFPDAPCDHGWRAGLPFWAHRWIK